MLARREVTQNSPQVIYTLCLLYYKYKQPVSPLECALPQFLATVHSKELTRSANSFRIRTYAKTRGECPRSKPALPPPIYSKGNTCDSGWSRCRSKGSGLRNGVFGSRFFSGSFLGGSFFGGGFGLRVAVPVEGDL